MIDFLVPKLKEYILKLKDIVLPNRGVGWGMRMLEIHFFWLLIIRFELDFNAIHIWEEAVSFLESKIL